LPAADLTLREVSAALAEGGAVLPDSPPDPLPPEDPPEPPPPPEPTPLLERYGVSGGSARFVVDNSVLGAGCGVALVNATVVANNGRTSVEMEPLGVDSAFRGFKEADKPLPLFIGMPPAGAWFSRQSALFVTFGIAGPTVFESVKSEPDDVDSRDTAHGTSETLTASEPMRGAVYTQPPGRSRASSFSGLSNRLHGFKLWPSGNDRFLRNRNIYVARFIVVANPAFIPLWMIQST
jgi:hypothetical protein